MSNLLYRNLDKSIGIGTTEVKVGIATFINLENTFNLIFDNVSVDDVSINNKLITNNSLFVQKDVNIHSNLNINNITSIESEKIHIEDKKIILQDEFNNINNAGLILKNDNDESSILWNNNNEQWDINKSIAILDDKSYQINDKVLLSKDTLSSNIIESSLTSVGTISEGTWQGETIGIQYGGIKVDTYNTGNLLYYDSGDSFSTLDIPRTNINNSFLKTNNQKLSYEAVGDTSNMKINITLKSILYNSTSKLYSIKLNVSVSVPLTINISTTLSGVTVTPSISINADELNTLHEIEISGINKLLIDNLRYRLNYNDIVIYSNKTFDEIESSLNYVIFTTNPSVIDPSHHEMINLGQIYSSDIAQYESAMLNNAGMLKSATQKLNIKSSSMIKEASQYSNYIKVVKHKKVYEYYYYGGDDNMPWSNFEISENNIENFFEENNIPYLKGAYILNVLMSTNVENDTHTIENNTITVIRDTENSAGYYEISINEEQLKNITLNYLEKINFDRKNINTIQITHSNITLFNNAIKISNLIFSKNVKIKVSYETDQTSSVGMSNIAGSIPNLELVIHNNIEDHIVYSTSRNLILNPTKEINYSNSYLTHDLYIYGFEITTYNRDNLIINIEYDNQKIVMPINDENSSISATFSIDSTSWVFNLDRPLPFTTEFTLTLDGSNLSRYGDNSLTQSAWWQTQTYDTAFVTDIGEQSYEGFYAFTAGADGLLVATIGGAAGGSNVRGRNITATFNISAGDRIVFFAGKATARDTTGNMRDGAGGGASCLMLYGTDLSGEENYANGFVPLIISAGGACGTTYQDRGLEGSEITGSAPALSHMMDSTSSYKYADIGDERNTFLGSHTYNFPKDGSNKGGVGSDAYSEGQTGGCGWDTGSIQGHWGSTTPNSVGLAYGAVGNPGQNDNASPGGFGGGGGDYDGRYYGAGGGGFFGGCETNGVTSNGGNYSRTGYYAWSVHGWGTYNKCGAMSYVHNTATDYEDLGLWGDETFGTKDSYEDSAQTQGRVILNFKPPPVLFTREFTLTLDGSDLSRKGDDSERQSAWWETQSYNTAFVTNIGEQSYQGFYAFTAGTDAILVATIGGAAGGSNVRGRNITATFNISAGDRIVFFAGKATARATTGSYNDGAGGGASCLMLYGTDLSGEDNYANGFVPLIISAGGACGTTKIMYEWDDPGNEIVGSAPALSYMMDSTSSYNYTTVATVRSTLLPSYATDGSNKAGFGRGGKDTGGCGWDTGSIDNDGELIPNSVGLAYGALGNEAQNAGASPGGFGGGGGDYNSNYYGPGGGGFFGGCETNGVTSRGGNYTGDGYYAYSNQGWGTYNECGAMSYVHNTATDYEDLGLWGDETFGTEASYSDDVQTQGRVTLTFKPLVSKMSTYPVTDFRYFLEKYKDNPDTDISDVIAYATISNVYTDSRSISPLITNSKGLDDAYPLGTLSIDNFTDNTTVPDEHVFAIRYSGTDDNNNLPKYYIVSTDSPGVFNLKDIFNPNNNDTIPITRNYTLHEMYIKYAEMNNTWYIVDTNIVDNTNEYVYALPLLNNFSNREFEITVGDRSVIRRYNTDTVYSANLKWKFNLIQNPIISGLDVNNEPMILCNRIVGLENWTTIPLRSSVNESHAPLGDKGRAGTDSSYITQYGDKVVGSDSYSSTSVKFGQLDTSQLSTGGDLTGKYLMIHLKCKIKNDDTSQNIFAISSKKFTGSLCNSMILRLPKQQYDYFYVFPQCVGGVPIYLKGPPNSIFNDSEKEYDIKFIFKIDNDGKTHCYNLFIDDEWQNVDGTYGNTARNVNEVSNSYMPFDGSNFCFAMGHGGDSSDYLKTGTEVTLVNIAMHSGTVSS